MINSVY